ISFTVNATSVGQNNASIQFQSNGARGSATSVPVSWIGYEGFFATPVETGLPYTVIINRILVDNQIPAVGSEIALMEGERVVGLGVYTGSFPLSITAWHEDTQQGLSGFTQGDSISAKISTFKYDQQLEVESNLEIKRGDGTYGNDAFSVIGIKGITGFAPTVKIDESPLLYEDLPQNYTETLRKWIFNTGDEELRINSASATGNFSVDEVGSYLLGSGDSTYVDILFRANTIGINEGVFILSTNDPFNTNVDISLRGRALIEVSEERVSLPDSESPWLHSPLNAQSDVSLMLKNNFARTEAIDLSIENSSDVSLQQSSITIAGNESNRLGLDLTGSSVGADTLQLVLTFQDGSRQEIELYQLTYEDHFEEVVETGVPYSLVLNLNEPGKPYNYGDQIAVFDGNQIVGLHVWKGSNSNIPVTAWKANPTNNLPGYYDGNDISFKVYKNAFGREEPVELGVFSNTFSGDGKFGSGAFQAATIEADEPIYFKDRGKTVYFRENQFSATTYASLDTLINDPNNQTITHTFTSDTSALVASRFANFYRLQLQQEFYGEVNVAHAAETETSSALDTTTFIIIDEPAFQSSEAHDVLVGDDISMALFDVQMDRELTHSVEILNDGYANLNVFGDSLSMDVLKEGVFYIDVNVRDDYGFDITKRISFTARYEKPWITTQIDTLKFNTVNAGESEASSIVLSHTLPVSRNYSIAFKDGNVFSAEESEVSLDENGSTEVEITFSPNSENVFSDKIHLIYNGFETDTSFTLTIVGMGQALPIASAELGISTQNFGYVKLGETLEKSFWIYNTSNVAMTVDPLLLDSEVFSVQLSTDEVPAFDSIAVKTSFSPVEGGNYNEDLQFVVNPGSDTLDITLNGNGSADIGVSFSTYSLNFGDVELGSKKNRSLTITNSGDIDIRLDSMETSNMAYGIDFQPALLKPDSSMSFEVAFSPTQIREYNDSLNVYIQDLETMVVSLDGRTASAFSEISVSAQEFGNVKIGENSIKSFWLYNRSNIALTVDTLLLEREVFSVKLTEEDIRAFDSVAVETVFTPMDAISYSQDLQLVINSDTLNISLNGKGFEDTSLEPSVSFSLDSLNFGETFLEKQNTNTLIIRNNGNVDLSIDSVLVTTEVFTYDFQPSIIEPDSSMNIPISFQPTQIGLYEGRIEVSIKELGKRLIHVTGLGIAPVAELSQLSYDFGEVNVGEISELDLWLYNRGNASLVIDTLILDSEAFSVAISEYEVGAQDSVNLTAKFSPTDVVSYEDELVLKTNALVDTLRLIITGYGASIVSVEEGSMIPSEYALEQNYPNPFNPSTTIKYALPEAANVQLLVYDLLGRQVSLLVSKQQSAGYHEIQFDASRMATGIYIYRIEAGDFVQTKKLMLIK
ncbi:MAG TPA: hypothetical protein DD671_11945, partial [Balneolaceae bacterium]|nr:hypothetical protein [Balneolaceae bacterium]